MSQGLIVADGPANEIKATVGRNNIRVTLPDARLDLLADLPGVASVDRRGTAVVLSCEDSDRAIRALLAAYPEAKDIEITGAGLEEAFLALTKSTVKESA
jgi:ABC-2 type transport system ATP-binding protein